MPLSLRASPTIARLSVLFSPRGARAALLAVFLLLCIVHGTRAQTTMTISGQVLDSDTKAPVSFAAVGIAATSFGAVSDENGFFTIKDIPSRPYKLIVSHVAYDRLIIDISPKRALNKLEALLKPKTVELEDVTVLTKKGFRKRRRSLERFKKVLFGSGYDKKQIYIENEEVLNFEDKITANVRSQKPLYLKIINKQLGYSIEYFDFNFQLANDKNWFKGLTRFEALKTLDAQEQKEWEENRKKAYSGSIRHFLKSLINNQLEEEGFLANLTNKNPGRHQPTTFIKETEQVFFGTKGQKGVNVTVSFNEEKQYYEVSYDKGKTIETLYFGDNQDREPSYLVLEGKSIRIYRSGALVDPLDFTMYGEYATKGVYQMLPINYEPTQ